MTRQTSNAPARAALKAANAVDRAQLAVVETLLLLLRLSAPKGDVR